ncbi:uncharacterized protein LOC105692601 isoform X3 [Athalia rosae]|uniref:uncharacterized protein LOC105692601 isoform X3 n=1 Tax=Athalia rosae TaxID=37344 RepID=UPI0020336B28|nr:uncharacterized protein LOC105692601 isoform X3 [Athalia rosae]
MHYVQRRKKSQPHENRVTDFFLLHPEIAPEELRSILEVLRRDAAILDIVRLKLSRAAQSSEKSERVENLLDDSRCSCCLKPFLIGRGVVCEECGGRVCRKGCSRWNTEENAWHCLFCHQRRSWLKRNEKWFETFGGLSADHDDAANRFSTAKSQVFLAEADYARVGPDVDLAIGGEEEAGDSIERVRDIIEKIVDGIVGNVDDIPIERLFDHPEYDQLMETYKKPLARTLARLAISLQLSIGHKPATDTPTMAHSALRELVERAVDEARKLPGLGASNATRTDEQTDISDQTYEDLLATAILNKVIEKYQNERVDNNSNTVDENKTSSRPKYISSEIEVGLDEGVEEGSSSLEPLSQDEYSSDCSAPASKYSLNRQEPMSLTIEEHIEEVTTTYTSDEEEEETLETNGLDFRNSHRVPFPEFGMDIIDPSQESSEETQDEATTPTHVDLVTPVESWEENWLFQKKKMQAQSEPVAMLVPNPSEDFRPLIGDREADDTSDLSDCSAQSDEEIEEELLEAINNVIPKIPGSPESYDASPSFINKEITELENQIENDVTKIKGNDGLEKLPPITLGKDHFVENPLIHLEVDRTSGDGITIVHSNGYNEEENENQPPKTPEFKLGIEDMLVFNVSADRIAEPPLKVDNTKDSLKFIQEEKLSINSTLPGEKIGDGEVEESKCSFAPARQEVVEKNERQVEEDILSIDKSELNSSSKDIVDFPLQAVESRIEECDNNVKKEIQLPQLTRDVKLPVPEADISVQELPQLTKDFKLLVNDEEVIKLTGIQQELEKSVNEIDSSLKKVSESPDVTTDLKLSPDESNGKVEDPVPLPRVTRDFKIPVDEGTITVENNVEQVTEIISETVADEIEVCKLEQNNLQGRLEDVKNAVAESVNKLDIPADQVEAEGSVAILKDFGIDNSVTNQVADLDDDIYAEELPRTPRSSLTSSSAPILDSGASETGIQTDLRSLEEKLVSVETRIDSEPDSFANKSNEDAQIAEEVLSSLSTLDNILTGEELNDIVEARLIYVETSGNENSYTVNSHQEDGAQQESEYTEHYDTATQRHLDSLTRSGKSKELKDIQLSDVDRLEDIPPPIPSTPPPIARLRQCREAAALAEVEDVEKPITAERKRVEVDLFLATPPRPGTIAEREHKKWENAAPIENNPYSEENIQKRLLQRQYTRITSSETSSGDNAEVTKMEGNSLQVVLGAGQPDVKRYGRDYYINDSKKANGELARRSTLLNALRRNSSLSQNSGSYDEDTEPQMHVENREPKPLSNNFAEVTTKVASWQQNNIESNVNVVTNTRQKVETTIQLEVTSDEVNGNHADIESTESSISEVNNSWEEQNTDELLDNVRRNSKNEMNAKLNNQEETERIVSVVETKKSFVNGNQKSIHRIDLKAYGFENEIKTNKSSVTKVTPKRVINKLDLKSFGYDSELQRIQSTGHIDEKLNNEISTKPRIVKMKTKSNLTEHHVDYERSKSSHNFIEYEASGDFDKTRSTEILNADKNISEEINGLSGMISAKSMPNVAKIEYYSQNITDTRSYGEEANVVTSNFSTIEKFRDEDRLSQKTIESSVSSRGLWKSESTLIAGEKVSAKDTPSNDELEDGIVKARSTEVLAKREIFEQKSELNNSISSVIEEDLPLPSVRKLAQVFAKVPAERPIASTKIFKATNTVKKERPTTPEVHIIETPRQMHSLTARSISREFREGLRQIPIKMTSTVGDQAAVFQRQPEVISSDVDSSMDDIAVIAPGKLKNNIKFWEQLQKQS